jgi:hypothetical protein
MTVSINWDVTMLVTIHKQNTALVRSGLCQHWSAKCIQIHRVCSNFTPVNREQRIHILFISNKTTLWISLHRRHLRQRRKQPLQSLMTRFLQMHFPQSHQCRHYHPSSILRRPKLDFKVSSYCNVSDFELFDFNFKNVFVTWNE